MKRFKNAIYSTKLGQMLLGNSEELLRGDLKEALTNQVQLFITSPPFPLNHKKSYGNLKGGEYQEWLSNIGLILRDLLAPDGSIVIEIGNSWEPGRPVQSVLHLESLLSFMKKAELNLIQEFICYNPSKLPTPANWVTINRIRAVDSYTHVWWLAKSDFPKADNRKVLRPYSKSMLSLLERQSYNDGLRPSGHKISESGFLKDNNGSISHNLFEFEPIEHNKDVRLPSNISEYVNAGHEPGNVLSLSNTSSGDYFSRRCRDLGIVKHPATMHPALIAFFVHFLTDEGDTIVDPFAGSNTTGYIAERLGRKWIGIEVLPEFAEQSLIRFEDPALNVKLRITKCTSDK
jgi:site-specific DNA-methyltransferase (cytosine-N4-specific)